MNANETRRQVIASSLLSAAESLHWALDAMHKLEPEPHGDIDDTEVAEFSLEMLADEYGSNP